MARKAELGRRIGIPDLGVAWFLVVAVDFVLNAGLLTPLWDQETEAVLLPDEVLFRRIPVTYAVLFVAVLALSKLLDVLDVAGTRHGAGVGAVVGTLAALLGVVNLWTAIAMTGGFVVAAALVQIAQLTAAGWFLGARRSGTVSRRRAAGVAVALVILAIVLQNLV